MAKTKAELRDRVLQKLGRLALGQTAGAEVAADIEAAYDEVYAELDSAELITFASNSIPEEFVEPIASMVAFTRSEGIPAERYQRIAQQAAQAPAKIAGIVNGPTYDTRKYQDY